MSEREKMTELNDEQLGGVSGGFFNVNSVDAPEEAGADVVNDPYGMPTEIKMETKMKAIYKPKLPIVKPAEPVKSPYVNI